MERARELIETIRSAADELCSLDLPQLAPQQLGQLLQRVEAARSVTDAAANAVLDRFDAEGGAAFDGLRTTTSWLTQRCQMTSATASRRVRTTRALRHLPIVADGFRQGRFSADQADLFARTRNPRTSDAMVQDEATLAGLADRLRPDHFGRELRGWAELVDTDGAEPDPGHRDRSFNFVQTLDDSWTGRLDLSAADGLLLNGAVDAMAEALYREHEAGARTTGADPTAVDGDAVRAVDGLGATGGPAAGGTRSRAEAPALRSPAQRRADALLELVRRGCGKATGAVHAGDGSADGAEVAPRASASPGRRGTPRVTLYLTLDAGDLEGGRGADTLDGHHLGAGATDRLLCDAAITAVLRDPWSGAVLNFGRDRRVVTPAQRAALAIRDRGCSFPGCSAPPQDCDAHHIVHWRNGGRTDIDNLALACWATHHPLAHEGRWTIVGSTGGRPTWFRPDGTPVERRPGWLAEPPDTAASSTTIGCPRPASLPANAHRPGRPPDRGPGCDEPDRDEPDRDDLIRMARERAHALRRAA